MLLFIWLCYSLYRQLTRQENLPLSLSRVKHNLQDNWPALLLVVILMFVNWGIEARKWQILVAPFEKLPFRKAFYSILAGVSISIITPNRVGEYGGRVMFLKSGNRLKGVSVTGVGSLSQFMTTMFFGMTGILYFIFAFDPIQTKRENGLIWEWLFLALAVVLFVMALLLYFHLDRLTWVFQRIRWLRRFKGFVKIINVFSNSRLLGILGLSAIRYIVFSAQYLILLQALGANVLWWKGFMMLFLIYVCLALIPTITIAELGIRGELGIWLLGLISANKVAILAATLGIWLVNLLIPAILGSVLLPGIKVFSEEHEVRLPSKQ